MTLDRRSVPSTTDLPALYLRFEKDRKFHVVAQLINSALSPNGELEVDEVLQVAERLADVLAARPAPELTVEQRATVVRFGLHEPDPQSSSSTFASQQLKQRGSE